VCHSQRSVEGGCSSPFHRPGARRSVKSVTQSQCDARPTVTFPAAGPPPLDRTELYCLVTETNEWEQLAQGCCLKAELRGMGIGSRDPLSRRVQRPNHYTIRPYYTGMSVLRICDCHTFHLLLHFFAYFDQVHISHIFFRIHWHFRRQF